MSKRKTEKPKRGRPSQGLAETQVNVTGPALLLGAVAARAEQEGITVREAWRRAGRAWIGWSEVAEVSGDD